MQATQLNSFTQSLIQPRNIYACLLCTKHCAKPEDRVARTKQDKNAWRLPNGRQGQKQAHKEVYNYNLLQVLGSEKSRCSKSPEASVTL